MSSSVCRLCLVGDVRMHGIEDIQLLEIYEKLASAKLDTEIGMPSTACYICYSLLQRCCKFSQMAQRSDIILRHVLHEGIEVTHTMFQIYDMSATPTQCMFIIDNSNSGPTKVSVKEEQAVVKEETTAENDATINDNSNSGFTKVTVEEEQVVVIEETTSESDAMIETVESAVVDDFEISDSLNIMEQSIKDSSVINKTDLYFSCDVCHKRFTKKYPLMAHLRTHIRQQPYACIICDKAVAYKKTWILHMFSHTFEKPFDCDRCGKAFVDKRHLIHHLYIHVGEKPYACNRCDKAYNLKCSLMKHITIIHSGEKPVKVI